jgi:hypothetical protein
VPCAKGQMQTYVRLCRRSCVACMCMNAMSQANVLTWMRMCIVHGLCTHEHLVCCACGDSVASRVSEERRPTARRRRRENGAERETRESRVERAESSSSMSRRARRCQGRGRPHRAPRPAATRTVSVATWEGGVHSSNPETLWPPHAPVYCLSCVIG